MLNEESKLIYKVESYAIRGAIHEVYREVGAGFLEAVYQECLEREFALQNIPFVAQQTLALRYKGEQLQQHYQPDFVCYEKIIIEIKSVKELLPQHEAQLINYMRAANMRVGFLVNFSHVPKAQIKRFVR